MIRIAICDHDVASLESVYSMVMEHLHVTCRDEFHVRRFHSVYDLLECLENPTLNFNVYILEINMPMYTGIEVGKMIRKNDEYADIIYMASSGGYALDASETAPLKYLVKPVQEQQLVGALEGASRKLVAMSKKNLLIKRKDGLSNISMHQIEYIEYRNHALTFHLTDGGAIDSRVMQESFSTVFDSSLTDARFLKPHQSYAVNMDHVRSMNAKEFEMSSGAMVPISKRIYKDVHKQFIDYTVAENDAVII